MERLEGTFDVAFRGNSRHVEVVATGSWGQSEFFPSVDKVGSCVMDRHWLDDECLVFKCNEATAETAAQL